MRALLLLLATSACHTAPVAPADPVAPRQVVDRERYTVSQGGRLLGRLVAREIRDPAGPIRYYLVENAAGQWLGYVDAQGRFYRYEPFVADERFLGVYTMEKGLGLLYEVTPPLRIVPDAAAAEARPAAAGKSKDR